MDVMAMANWMLFFSLIVGWVTLNFILAELARMWFGSYWLWVLIFFLIPVFSYLFFIYSYIRMVRKKRALKVVKEVYCPSTVYHDLVAESDVDENGGSVTPFDYSEGEDNPQPGSDITEILNKCCNEKLDMLIEFGQWPQAREYAEKRLKNAVECNLIGEQKIYEAYLAIIENRISDFRS